MTCTVHNLKLTRVGTQRVCINGSCDYWEVVPLDEQVRSPSPTVEATALGAVQSRFDSEGLHDGSDNSVTPAKQKQQKKAKVTNMGKKAAKTQTTNTTIPNSAVVTPTAAQQSTTAPPQAMNGNSSFSLTKAVPIPEGSVRSIYPFPRMQPGDSFEVVGEKAINNVRNAAQKYKGSHAGVQFTSREMGTAANGQPVYRFWRRA